ncbi:G8 domain-containing protein [Rivularia sp. PCC 7116]|uniref:G8 domain-containing protein n=1 Tax=Rivularia sp. PCC 7116 TaxID=373994 RepID=UPI00029EC768|nr:G8 domain-containing protein [Rivularia sp. PCC 7116]AFY54653.1 G8 domain-containing protein [Rivularia sp. PCC 7116]
MNSINNMMHSQAHMNHSDNPVKQKEHMDLVNLSQRLNNPVVAINNGSWFDSNTWENSKIPESGDDVVISEGVTVTYDNASDTRLNVMRVDGKLQFASNQNTKLVIDSIFVSKEAELSIGTKDNPIQADKTAQIIFTSDTPIDTNWDVKQLSRGLVSHGKVDIFGTEKTDFLTLQNDVFAGTNQLILKNVPEGWQVGDTIVVGGTQYDYDGKDEDNSRFQDEVLTITEINGNIVKFTNNDITSGDNTVLRFDHKRPDIAEKDQLNLYVANTSRNVSFATENADRVPLNQRAHVMFMHNTDVRVYNAGFYGLGRTDKSIPVDDIGRNLDGSVGNGTNIRSRYALHFHRAGSEDINGMAAIAKGNAIVDSPGWGIVHHDSHAIIEDNVVFDVVGSGIITESGNEIGAWRNNITIKTVGFSGDRNALDPDSPRVLNFDFGFDGEGYWVQGAAAIAIEDNVAISAAGGGINIYGGNDGGESVRDKKFIDVKNLPDYLKNIAKGTDDETKVDVGAVPFQLSGFESYNSRDGIFSWGKVRNDDGQLDSNFDSEGLKRPAHEYISTLEDFKLWNIYEKGIVLFYNNNFEFKDGLIVGDSTDINDRHGLGIFTNHASKEEIFDNLKIKRFEDGLTVPFDAGKDFIASELKNSSFSEIDNVFVSTEPPKPEDNFLEEIEDFPSYFEINNTEFEPVVGNLAPTATFQTQAIGGYAIQLDASASFDEDTDAKFKNQPSKGIVAYGWDLNNDGDIDKFGRKINHYFDKAGLQDITLKVWDNQGTANTITQAINIQQTAYKNPLINGDFSSNQLGEDYKANSTAANQGWFATPGTKHNSDRGGSVVLSGEFSAGLSQIIYDNQITRGLQTLSFNFKNIEGSSEPLQENQILVTVYGVNGEFENDLYSGEGPTQVGVLPMDSFKLLEEDFGGSDYDWKEITRDIDLGTGYDYLMFQINTKEANQSGDLIAIDDVAIIGEGLPIVTPEDIIVPELIQELPEIEIPTIDIPEIENPQTLGTNPLEIENSGIYTLPEGKNLKFNLDNISTENVSEIGIFIVDDQNGNINGIAPNSPDYLQAALSRSQVIFSTISNSPNGFNPTNIKRILELDSQRQFGFYTIPNGSRDTAITEIRESGKTNLTVLFSNSSQIQVSNFNQQGFSLELSAISLNVQFAEDTSVTGTKLQTQTELIDLRDETVEISVNIDVYREAEYDNIIGFYQIADAEGGIDITGDGIADINVGEQGYRQAALDNRITSIDLLQTENQQTASYDGILQGGSLISSFMIVDAGLQEAINGEAEVLFSQLGANTDNVDSVRILGDNIFGFEDSGNTGDFDYNDMIVKIDFGV